MSSQIVVHKPFSNCVILELGDDRFVLYSYSTPVAIWTSKTGFLRSSKYYSQSTSYHIGQWMGQGAHFSWVSQETINRLTSVTPIDIDDVELETEIPEKRSDGRRPRGFTKQIITRRANVRRKKKEAV